MKEAYRHVARLTAEGVGTAGAFLAAVLLIAVWGLTGPVFGFSNTWQLVINTVTTVITFLMVFLIQYAQNRDNKTVQLKLDELIKAVKQAHNSMIDLEGLSDDELASLEAKYKHICEHTARRRASASRQAGAGSFHRKTVAP
jgi:low affinity Fe/Cu permease